MQPRDNVAVGVEGDADVRVAQPLLHHLRMHTSLQSRVAQPWRKSCNRIAGNPSGCTASEKPRVNRSGCSIVPSTWQNARSLSFQPAPINRRAAACFLRCSRRAATVPESRVIVRRPFAVLGVPSIAVCLTAITVCRIDARPASRSRSRQRRPSTSPRRMPEVASSRYAVQCLLVRVPSRKVRSWSAVHVIESGRPASAAFGGSAASAGFRASLPHLTASLRARQDRVDVAHRTRGQPTPGVVLPTICQQ